MVQDCRRVRDQHNDELHDLDRRDVLLPPDVLAGRNNHHEVVPVPADDELKKSNYDSQKEINVSIYWYCKPGDASGRLEMDKREKN